MAFTFEFPTPKLFLSGKKNSLQLLPPCDCLLNRSMEPVISPHKEEREQNLSEQRNKGRKI